MLPDLLASNHKLVIVGTASGNKSAERQAYNAGSTNRFWKTLHQVGLTPRELAPHEYRHLLEYGIGLTDLVKGKAGMDHVLEDEDFDRVGLDAKIQEYCPSIVCFNGKRAAQAYLRRKNVEYGLQDAARIKRTKFFVAPQTSGANGHWSKDVGHWYGLACLAGKQPNDAVALSQANLAMDHVVALRNWAVRTPAIRTLWLFGSRSRGEARPGSDVDLAIDLVVPSDFNDTRYCEAIDDAPLDSWQEAVGKLVPHKVGLHHFRGPLRTATVFAGLSRSSIVLFQRQIEPV